MNKKLEIILSIIVAISLITLVWLTVGFSYNYFLYEKDVYDCAHMTRQQFKIFETLGIKTHIMHGQSAEVKKVSQTECILNIYGHYWLRIDLGFTSIDWECTYLMPLYHHSSWQDVNEVKVEDIRT